MQFSIETHFRRNTLKTKFNYFINMAKDPQYRCTSINKILFVSIDKLT